VRVWHEADLKTGDWKLPACSGWRSGEFKLVVALAGSFPHAGTAGELLGRFGRISLLRNIRYWSVSDREWRLLIQDAAALDGAEARRRRADFGVEEMKDGRALYFVQEETRLSVPVAYRMRVLEFRPDRIVVQTENVGAVRMALIPLVEPGGIRAVHFLERIAPGLWGYYGLVLSGPDVGLFARVRDASLINRAAAFYRHFVGIPTDREPPQAP